MSNYFPEGGPADLAKGCGWILAAAALVIAPGAYMDNWHYSFASGVVLTAGGVLYWLNDALKDR